MLAVRHLALGRRARGRAVRVVIDRETNGTRSCFGGRRRGGRVGSLLHLVFEGIVEEVIGIRIV